MPILTPVKPDGSVRICADYKCTINKALQQIAYPVPVVQHLMHLLGSGKIFAKLDMVQAYQQLPVDGSTVEAQTIVMHRGAFKCNRLQFSISIAPGLFQSIMERLLQEIPVVVPYFNDILLSVDELPRKESVILIKTAISAMMGIFSYGPFVMLCLVIAGSEYSTGKKLKYTLCKHYKEIGRLKHNIKPTTFWRVDCHHQKYFSLGDIAVQGSRKPHNSAIIVKDETDGLLGHPKGLRAIWRGSGNNDFTVFEMDCEHGFKALGNIVVKNSSQFPHLSSYRCVHETILVRGKCRIIWEDIGHINRTNIGVWEVVRDPSVAPGSISVWTFVFENKHNIPAKIVYTLNRDKVMTENYPYIRFMKTNDSVCADLESTEPTGSPFITLIPASTVNPRLHISDPSRFCNDKPDGNYAYPANPHKYHRCSNGQTVIMNCPVYNTIRDWPSNLIEDEFCKDKLNGNYTYLPDPHKYYACCDGNTELNDCPPGQIFINIVRQCSWPFRFL
ncbi:uncharacterized protein LOC116509435 [Thamnophis elegans]|uniref:uncharacterized protein LOC116509435 n=1 Tax=Thamnophis elegans TaxID=35005 RepID=UPI00137857DE|nr:uncharacterized protein LOC116509435 [Thamnophis elegans]